MVKLPPSWRPLSLVLALAIVSAARVLLASPTTVTARSLSAARDLVASQIYLPFVANPSTSTPTPVATATPVANNCAPTPTLQRSTGTLPIVGQSGGAMNTIAFQGNFAYVGVGQSLDVVDVSNPDQPTLVGQSALMPGPIQGVAISGNDAYVIYRNGQVGGFQVIDISNPVSPTVPPTAFTFRSQELPFVIAVSGNDAYVATPSALEVVDISDPSHPNWLINAGVQELFFPHGIAVANNDVYVTATDQQSLFIFSAANPNALQKVATVPLSAFGSDVAVSGNRAYVADGTGGPQTFDVTDPTAAKLLGSVAIPGSAVDVSVNGQEAYVSNGSTGLSVVDVSAPSRPAIIGCALNQVSVFRTASSSSHLYATTGTGLHVLDVSTPSTPTDLGSYRQPAGKAMGVAVSGTNVYIADSTAGLRVFDVSSPGSPTEIGFVAEPGAPSSVVHAGQYAYVAAEGGGLRIVDASQPTKPVEVGSYVGSAAEATGIAIAGTTAYLADLTNGLVVVDVTNPTSPQLIAQLPVTDRAAAVAVANGFAYVAGSTMLHVISLASPSAPVEVAHVTLAAPGVAITTAGSDVDVVEGNGATLFDVSVPTSPTIAGSCLAANLFANGIAVDGSNVYIVGAPNGIAACDEADPSHPVQLGFSWLPDEASGVAAANGRVYVADESAGLLVMELPPS
jgi:hypothetical protein